MKKILLLLLVTFIFQQTYAQSETASQTEEMETDRPNVGNAATVVPKGVLQFELGLNFKNDETNFLSVKEYQLPEISVRYGLLDFLELRLGGQITHQVHDLISTPLAEKRTSHTGFEGLRLGAKFQLVKMQGARPNIALQTDFELPVGDKTLKAEELQPKIRLNFKNDLTEALSLNYNLGVVWDDYLNKETNEVYHRAGIYTLALQYELTETLQIAAEAFGELHQEDMQQSFDVGVAYKLKPNLQVDSYAGVGFSEEAPDYFVSAGVSFRLP